MKIISYNVNGLRAAVRKGLPEWLAQEMPDVLCIQETKLQPEQFDPAPFHQVGYPYTYFHSAQKKGYSGVAIFSRTKPEHIEWGMGMEAYDNEGRFIRADFRDISIVSAYHPSGQSGELRQSFKMQWLADFHQYVNKLRTHRPKLILCGDYNICHEPIDIHDPVRNATVSGFLPEERAWMSQFLADGYVDAFRHLYPETIKYSWWSYRAGARAGNKGWRIDYSILTENLCSELKEAEILNDAVHSDHCPVSVTL